MKDIMIEKFGQKLMVASKSVNKIPTEYMSYSQNARIYDWGIWPRKGKKLLTNSTLWTNNKGGFVLWTDLYQITNGKIYLIDKDSWDQTEKATLCYDNRTDILTFSSPKWDYVKIDWPFTDSYNYSWEWVFWLEYVKEDNQLRHYSSTDAEKGNTNLPINLETYTYPVVNVLADWTTNYDWWWTSEELEDWERVRLTTQTNTWDIAYELWYYETFKDIAIIVSEWEQLAVFDWEAVSFPTTAPRWWAIIEYLRWFTFLALDNVLYISEPITANNPENAYDYLWAGSQTILFDTPITWLESTLNWLYIFTKDKVEFLWANSLQNVAWSATFISTPIWNWWEPVNNLCITSSWDKIFYLTKNLSINTINYISWTEITQIWELSSRPIIAISELLKRIDTDQPNAYAFYNQNDETIQFHVRSEQFGYNDVCIVYDLVNDTWNIDTGKNYNYIVKDWSNYYGYSDVNSSIYEDDTWFSDSWTPIQFLIKTQDMNQWTLKQKMYWWMLTAWAIWPFTEIQYRALIDSNSVFTDSVNWNTDDIEWIWEIWGDAIWENPIWWDLAYISNLTPFDRTADAGRIYRAWIRMQIEIFSDSLIQDFNIDMLWLTAKQTNHRDTSNNW